MVKFGCGRKYHDLKYFEVGFFIFLEFNMNLRTPLQILYKTSV